MTRIRSDATDAPTPRRWFTVHPRDIPHSDAERIQPDPASRWIKTALEGRDFLYIGYVPGAEPVTVYVRVEPDEAPPEWGDSYDEPYQEFGYYPSSREWSSGHKPPMARTIVAIIREALDSDIR